MGTYVSLFAGIGGIDIAVEAYGYECVAQVEWDAACTRTLERWWPSVPRWGDIHEFTAAAYAEVSGGRLEGRAAPPAGTPRLSADGERSDDQQDVGRSAGRGSVDLIVGGFPCQPASTAGRRKGTEDDRWLWPEFARVIGELGPRHVLVENVPGLLTVNGGRAFSEVVGTLADLGYDATWRSVRAADVGAPHRRERIFLLAHTNDRGHGAELRPPSLTGLHQGEAGPEPARADRRAFPWGAYATAIERWERVMGPAPHPVDDKGRLAPPFVEWLMGFPAGWTDQMSRTQALKALGNAVVNQQAILAMEVLS